MKVSTLLWKPDTRKWSQIGRLNNQGEHKPCLHCSSLPQHGIRVEWKKTKNWHLGGK